MTKVNNNVNLTTRDYLEALVFSAVFIVGLPASIFLAMAIAG